MSFHSVCESWLLIGVKVFEESLLADNMDPIFPIFFPEVDSENSRVCLWQSKEESEQLLNVLRPFIPENWWEGTRLSDLHDVLQFERLACKTANILFLDNSTITNYFML